MKVNWKDLAIRAGKTFGQAFLSSICIESVFEVTSLSSLKAFIWSVAVAGLAAGISAVWNLLITYVCNNEFKIETEED